ncbi:MAG: MBOAT family protein [Clostridia bacterium]|nr:MBOAT family protein [Clostridia bacterium]
MLFSSITFLYAFLPALLILYFVIPPRGRNLVLLLASLLFYAWGEPIYLFLMLGSILAGYVFGLLIDRFRSSPRIANLLTAASVCVSLSSLILFKYSDFFLSTVNTLTGSSFKLLGLALPVGISFYTFQILSYTVDVRRGDAPVQRNPLTFATYVALFPQLIAGPIVRYVTVAEELGHRTVGRSDIAYGVGRFTVGLGKKVLLANVLGELCQIYRDTTDASVLFTWLYAIAYALHLYFDFSGYSDMAIGLGRIFGFHFLENFNFPYISRSITEFWRRWHMSLGTWFRDYVYIPLGGNRVSRLRWVFNLSVVWMLTGFWHGAGWTFILWGLWFGLWLIAEKLFLGKWLAKLPAALSWIWTTLLVILGFVLFDADGLTSAITRMGNLFGAGLPLVSDTALYYLRSYAVVLIVGIIGATPLPAMAWRKIRAARIGETVSTVIEPLAVGCLLLLVSAYLIDGSYNPFIYFRF